VTLPATTRGLIAERLVWPRRVWRITEVGSASKLGGAASHRISGSARAERTNIQGATAERSRRCNGIKCYRGLRTSIFSQRTAAKKPRDVVALRPRKESLRVKGPSHSKTLTPGLGWFNRAIMSDSLQKKESGRNCERSVHVGANTPHRGVKIPMLRVWTRTCHRRQ
jgi:hypothetical protein